MKFDFDAVVVSVLKRESKGKEYFHLNLDQDGEIVTLQCDPEVAKVVQKYKPYHLTGLYSRSEYEGRVYTRMVVVGVKS